MPRNWQHAVQETVQSNRYVALPEPVREHVEVDHALDGPSVFWNYEHNVNYVVLSARSLQQPSYVDVGRYTVYGADDDGQARVRPPERLNDVLASKFTEGSRVMYLAFEEMTEGDNPMVYLLTTGQLLDLLPREVGERAAADGGDGIREAILRSPGFLPSP